MIEVQEALKRVLEHTGRAPVISLPLQEAMFCVLAEDIFAREDSPRFHNSAMDGFAVCTEDTKGASADRPVRLKVVGESRAGVPFSGRVAAGGTVRISTGAKIPEGTDAVVPLEECQQKDDWLLISTEVRPGAHIRFAGEEFRQGTRLLRKGTILHPGCVGLLAAQGIHQVTVFRHPRVSVLVTGTELVPYSTETLQEGQIRDSNTPMLVAAAKASGAEVIFQGQIPDEESHTRHILEEAAEKADFVLVTGGISVGPHDLVKGAAEAIGFRPLFWKVRQKPGKPLFVAERNGTLMFGLPGNPVSALTCYAYYVHPALRLFSGQEFHWPKRKARLREAVKNKGKRSLFLRVRLIEEGGGIVPLPNQGSHMLTSVAQADGFLLLHPQEEKRAGEEAEMFIFPWRQIWGI